MSTAVTPAATPSPRFRLVVPGTVFAGLIAMGIFHGVWTDRWEKANDPALVEARLQRMPMKVGDWDGQDESAKLPETPPGMLGPLTVRRYTNRKNGDTLLVYLTAGRTGPLLVNHQPTDCYPGIGYNLASGPTKYAVPLGGSVAQFLIAQFNKTEPVPSYVRVYWSFSGAGDWQVPTTARFAFARFPVLYKLYVVHQLKKPGEPLESDPANELIKVLVPELQKTVFANA